MEWYWWFLIGMIVGWVTKIPFFNKRYKDIKNVAALIRNWENIYSDKKQKTEPPQDNRNISQQGAEG